MSSSLTQLSLPAPGPLISRTCWQLPCSRPAPSAQPVEAPALLPRSCIAGLPAHCLWLELTVATGSICSFFVYTAQGYLCPCRHSQAVKQLWFGQTLTQYLVKLYAHHAMHVTETKVSEHKFALSCKGLHLLGCKLVSRDILKLGLHSLLLAQVADPDRTFPYPMHEIQNAAKVCSLVADHWVTRFHQQGDLVPWLHENHHRSSTCSLNHLEWLE